MNKFWQTPLFLLSLGLMVGCATTAAPLTESPPAATTAISNTPTTAPTPAATDSPIQESPTEATSEPTVATITAATEAPVESPTAEETTDLTVVWAGEIIPALQEQADFPEAGSIAFTLAADGTIYAALGIDNYMYAAYSTDQGATFSEPVRISEEQQAFVLPFERPAIVATADGRVSVAWSSPEFNGRIWYALSTDGGQTFGSARTISGSPATETILPRLIFDGELNPIAAWLSNSTLRIARSADAGETFAQPINIDNQTCECCHPQPLIDGDQLFVAYRNLEIDETSGQHTRDIFLARSEDGGQTFAEEIRISDAPWHINACPVSGPSLVKDADTIYVSWMDGRNDAQGNFRHTDVWLATSADGGQTFSANRRLNSGSGIYHNLPSLAADEAGTLHVVWEALEAERDVVYYAQSADQGMTFTTPVVLLDSQSNSGRTPGNTTLLIGADGLVYVSWVDSEGAHLASWAIGQSEE